MKKRDIVFILALTLIGVTGIFLTSGREGASKAYIYVNGALYGQYDLSDDTGIHIEGDSGIENDIRIENGSIRVLHATCPGQDCVHTGSIGKDNESICCAPAGVLIIVKSDETGEFDAVTK